jgi:RNA polymerase-binding protein DksA
MDKKDIKMFKEVLLQWKEKVLNELGRIESDNLGKSQKDFSGDLSGYSLHMADAGTDTFDREFALSLASNQQEFLYQIDEALKRIEDKSFGKCEICEKDITLKRLKAIPFAKFCIKCQEQAEKSK